MHPSFINSNAHNFNTNMVFDESIQCNFLSPYRPSQWILIYEINIEFLNSVWF